MRLETKFQDKDFELGEVVKAKVNTYYDENKIVVMADKARGGVSRFEYNSIKDFTDHWEDAPEEPKGIKSIEARYYSDENKVIIEYSSQEEASDAYEKARAWKRLEDKGFEFTGWCIPKDGPARVIITGSASHGIADELDLLFGGEK